MTRRERLMATLRGEAVDRPPLSFYEINGLDEDRADPDPFNIYNHRSWGPLIDLARDRTDRVVMRGVSYGAIAPDPIEAMSQTETVVASGSIFTTRRVRTASAVLTTRTRRDSAVNTIWTIEHLLKDCTDLRAYLDLPQPTADGVVEISPVLAAEAALGETGIVMIDTPDPLCLAASLFDMAEYTVIALTEPALFRRLLDRFAERLLAKTAAVAKALPGRLWRIYGPEYASPPYLPPQLFREYVCEYVTPMVKAIQKYGGYARIHCHGNLKDIIEDIAAMQPDALDPIEPPPQGDVDLADVRRRYGKQMVLFGNLEASDIENLPTAQFAEKVKRAIDAGTAGAGRGFVLMPSSCPYGRYLAPLALQNYQTMVDVVERL